jgi:hypothetical protein
LRRFSDEAGFAGLSLLFGGCSDLRSPFAGFGADCAGVFALSESCAARAAAVPKVIAKATTAIVASIEYVSRKAFTATDLSAPARHRNLLRLARIEEMLRRAPCNRRFSRQKRGIGLARSVDSTPCSVTRRPSASYCTFMARKGF